MGRPSAKSDPDRYTLEIEPVNRPVDRTELWPNKQDPDDPSMHDLVTMLNEYGMDDFLFSWEYARELTIRIWDNKNGGCAVWDGHRFRWEADYDHG